MSGTIQPILIGGGIGFFSGLLGKGGSAVTTPILRIFMGVPHFSALASPLPAALPTTISASAAYYGRDLVDWRAVKIACAWGIPATVIGSWASEKVGGHHLMELTAIFVIGLGISILRSRSRRAEEIATGPDAPLPRGRATAIAIGVGFLSGMLANTGGVLYAPLFIMLLGMEVKRALATSLIVAAVLAVPGTLAHWYLGHIDWRLAAALSIGAIPCSYLGARLAIAIRSGTLVTIYGIALTFFGLYDLLYTERALLHFGPFR